MRILIADGQHVNRLKIERLFNGFGFYCIYPTEKLDDALRLCQYPFVPFDLLVVNEAQLDNSKVNNIDCLKRYTTIRHYLVYSDRPTDRKIVSVGGLRLDSSAISIERVIKVILPLIE